MKTEQEARDLIKFGGNIDWIDISRDFKLSETFIEEFADKVNWLYIFAYQTLSVSFIENHLNHADWDTISGYQKLSDDFIIKHKDKIEFSELFFNKNVKISYNLYLNLPDKIKLKHVSFTENDVKTLLKEKKFDIKNILKMLNNSTINNIAKKLLKLK